MPVRKSEAVWNGTLREGNGTMKLGSGAFEGSYSFKRFEDVNVTNPDELLGAALAGCFSQAFSLELENIGYPPQKIFTTAKVHLEKVGSGFQITKIELSTDAKVPGIPEGLFAEKAETAKRNCPVGHALQSVAISLTASVTR